MFGTVQKQQRKGIAGIVLDRVESGTFPRALWDVHRTEERLEAVGVDFY
ncbi:MAG: hypothetical protein H0W96_02615 [Solirubrobacterales bacterium]|nr:hypothetical protein [Solirubrobacterales bacterium]